MVGIAQLVRAPDCGSGGRGFKPRYSPSVPDDARKCNQMQPAAKTAGCVVPRAGVAGGAAASERIRGRATSAEVVHRGMCHTISHVRPGERPRQRAGMNADPVPPAFLRPRLNEPAGVQFPQADPISHLIAIQTDVILNAEATVQWRQALLPDRLASENARRAHWTAADFFSILMQSVWRESAAGRAWTHAGRVCYDGGRLRRSTRVPRVWPARRGTAKAAQAVAASHVKTPSRPAGTGLPPGPEG